MSDKSILEHISSLVDEEHRLRSRPENAESTSTRLKHLTERLDQCWDLLRQRRAKREFGRDPAEAKLRDAGTVEGYLG
jgi:hypothetical protein